MNKDAPQSGSTQVSACKHAAAWDKKNITCDASDTRCDLGQPTTTHNPAQGTAPHTNQRTTTKHNRTRSSEMEAPPG